ncbi:DNA translocase FtsK [bacterium]|nr:DNA translocase FtsK [bacterium]
MKGQKASPEKIGRSGGRKKSASRRKGTSRPAPERRKRASSREALAVGEPGFFALHREVSTLLLASFIAFLSAALLTSTFFGEIAHEESFSLLQTVREFLFSFRVSSSELSVGSAESAASNIMGPAGAFCAVILTELFGFGAVVLPFSLCVTLFALWSPSGENDEESAALVGVVRHGILWFFFCGLFSALCAVFYGEQFGGWIGAGAASPLEQIFGGTGASFLLSIGLFLLSYFLFGAQFVRATAKVGGGAKVVFSHLAEWIGVLGRKSVRTLFFLARAGGRVLVAAGIHLVTRSWEGVCNGLERRRERRAEQMRQRERLTAEEGDPARARKKVQKRVTEEPFSDSDDSREIVVVDHSAPLLEARSHHLSRQAREQKEKEPPSNRAQANFPDFQFPSTELLREVKKTQRRVGKEELVERSEVIQAKLSDFNVSGKITHVHPGPVITMYEFEPAAGVKVGRVTALQDDLAMALRAPSIRIIAPLPERGSVGIEVPNSSQEIVNLRELLEYGIGEGQGARLPIPLGKDTFGAPVTGYIAEMPHLLLAGATGTGKSVCINAVLMSLLYRVHPEELQLILIDPKILELSIYEGIPHLKVPVVTDPRKAKAVLQWAVKEMDDRYRMLRKYGVRNIDAYNDLASGRTSPDEVSTSSHALGKRVVEEIDPLPKILIVIDELADLMLTSGREIEELITRLAQKARAAGIHLLLATQRPSVDVITGLIKANFPARVSFRVSSRIDSRTILDTMGAERLLGKGDMLFLRPGAHHLKRVHGAFVADEDVRKVTKFLRETCKPQYDTEVMEMCEKALEDSGKSLEPGEADTSDPLYDKAVQFVLERGSASTSMVQRQFRIGYNRAARIVDTMEQEGLVGPVDGAKPRPVLVPQASNDE